MRYAVPVNAAHEVGVLVEAGAGELYCGYQDAWWVERYGDHDSASRRQGSANFATLGELERCVREASGHGVPVWLALNSRYTEPQLDHLIEVAGRFECMGGTGVIASDLGLLWRLRNASLRRCLSILAVAQNRATLEAYGRLGVSRVVLPRFMGPSEAAELLAGVPAMEAEVMAFFDRCPWVDGYCRHRHGVTYRAREVQDEGNAGDDAEPLYTFDTTYQTHACLGRACSYLEPYPCAACSLPAFERAGVGFAKLGGRGRPLDERLRAVRFLRAAESLASDEERAQRYRSAFGKPCACYYGKTIQDRSAIERVVDPPEVAGTLVLGSQTSLAAYREALAALLAADGKKAAATLLVPPLPDGDLAELLHALPSLCGHGEPGFVPTLCVNDLGTYTSLARVHHAEQYPFALVAGTLLLRADDPAEVAHFLSAEENPPRAVWGLCGEPRMLTYRRPPDALIAHWKHPSLLEPSAQAALRELCARHELDKHPA